MDFVKERFLIRKDRTTRPEDEKRYWIDVTFLKGMTADLNTIEQRLAAHQDPHAIDESVRQWPSKLGEFLAWHTTAPEADPSAPKR
jgi:hypothetical protein